MEQLMDLLEFSPDNKRKMGRPPKIPPFSHYDAYKPADIDFFISLFSGREELYNPCEEFSDFRQKALHFIEKKCGHFLAMRKGRNAEKLWLYLFNDFEKLIRNGGDKNDERCKSIVVFYDCLKFLIPYLQKSDRVNLPNMPSSTFNVWAGSLKEEAKRPKLETTDQLNDDWLQKVIETVTNQASGSGSMIDLSSVLPVETTKCSTFTLPSYEDELEGPGKTPSAATSEKHADIISCVTNFLDEVPNDKLMLCKVRLFQFIEEEKNKLKEGKPFN